MRWKNLAAVNSEYKTKMEHDECIRLFMNGTYIYWTIAGRRREDCEQRVGDDDDDDDAVDDERVMNVNDGGRLQHPSQRLSCVR